ncbi:GmrSD restriction endonuclease domain-containing protein [Shewanella algae]|uniref:GmrSD restriction endonuclease domain-containing protein n=1 Tax=Shewanella algae TaxID=38313 RepID=UPI0008DCA7E5|nr:DUF262 domain-containing protein [Shewanella algae]MBO2646339.1 DUF262 domain-containing protein [Shewanella algae]OHY50615.1 hypothetical protein BEH76_06800 [Shewanella algae]QTE87824.1 DUF262 domain-containing protein [Shewanella algae]TVL07498.1 hypothetical protein AYI82_13655 [Shewanella algae]TVO81241.1 hypothetical protein AYI78_17465 [Shewanella algae]
MSITPRGMSVQEAYRNYRDGKLIVNRKYQRKLVWNLSEKQSLVDSIMKDYPIPLILLAEDSSQNSYEIMDGMQRLNAIFAFIENHFPIEGRYFDTDEFSRAKQLAAEGVFSAANKGTNVFLTPSEVADFLDYQLAVTVFPAGGEDKTTDVFGRINSGGRQLSLQERRQAGMVDDFSMLVRKLASEIRGDTSREILPLSEMPEISIDSVRADLGYELKAEEIFWCKQGIMWTRQLRESEDEEIIADICASLAIGQPIARSKELLDSYYDPSTNEYEQLRRSLSTYGVDRLYEEVKVTLSVLRGIIDEYSSENNALRSVINPGSTNPIKTAFYTLFMAMHQLVIVEELSPDSSINIMAALKNLQSDIKTTAKYSKTEDRVRNIDKTKGLISRHFVKKDPPMLRHGAGLALDLENSLRRSRVETGRYECKQGFVDLSPNRSEDKNLPNKILETICGIANLGPDADGFIFIGVADKKSDADRIKDLDGIDCVTVGSRYVVGIEREFQYLKCDHESYVDRILSFIRNSDLSDTLKHQVLTQVDYVDYRGISVIRIRIPAQKEISFLGDVAYTRENSSTVEANGKKLLAINGLFA